MLGKYQSVSGLDWTIVEQSVGAETFAQIVHGSRLIGMTNWTMLNKIESVWEKIGELLAERNDPPRKFIFVDLADPAKRTSDDLRGVFRLLTKLQAHADVVLGLNLSEATQALEVLGLDVPADPEADIEPTAVRLREKLDLHGCVVHPRKGAAAAFRQSHGGGSDSASFLGPFVAKPKLSTGAGDNFNAGFCLGLLAGLPLEQCLCTGVGTSGFYVRNARSPELTELATFCDDLPAPAE
jgi:hypothetical protein